MDLNSELEAQRETGKRHGVSFLVVRGKWVTGYVKPAFPGMELGTFTGPDGVTYIRSVAGLMSDAEL